ncbi:MAG: DUF1684 domain-containing protein [Rhodanobacteraceae bacterium]|nr:DUF1684 domain-containing protein [Rhodanobacteraceae bacterium]
MRFPHLALGLATLIVVVSPVSAAMTAHQQEIAAWRAARVERLSAPGGWLSLVGLHWLPEGVSQTLGNGPDNDIDLGRGPKRLGTLSWSEGKARFEVERGVEASVAGVSAESFDLTPAADGSPVVVDFGTANFQVIERGDKHALRVKDSQAPTRLGFKGISYFDIDPQWRINARFEAYDEPRTIEIATVVGTLESYPNPGRIVFEKDGKTHSIEALVEEGEEQYFLIIADRSSGKETYGMARYLYAGPPKDGHIVVDFNKAYNPPCAFTAFATCPMPPPGNRLDLYVAAGEKYTGEAH